MQTSRRGRRPDRAGDPRLCIGRPQRQRPRSRSRRVHGSDRRAMPGRPTGLAGPQVQHLKRPLPRREAIGRACNANSTECVASQFAETQGKVTASRRTKHLNDAAFGQRRQDNAALPVAECAKTAGFCAAERRAQDQFRFRHEASHSLDQRRRANTAGIRCTRRGPHPKR